MNYIPYTYLIGWTKHNKWYYGVETSSKKKVANPKNLWTIYFTSSEYVKEFRKKHGEPDVIEIRKTFKTKGSARDWEHKVLKRMKVVSDDKWLNKSDNRTHDRTGIKFTEEQKQKLKNRIPWNKDIPRTPEEKLKMSLARKGKCAGSKNANYGKLWDEKRLKAWSKLQKGKGNHFAGKTHTEETKKRMSEARKKYHKTHKIVPWNKGLKGTRKTLETQELILTEK